jgi:nicotinamidase-related amidase
MSVPSTPGVRNGSALLVIDVQQGLFAKSTPIYQAERLLTNIESLIQGAHHAGAPVFFVQHCSDKVLPEGSAEWQLHRRLRPQSTDHSILKHHGSAFEDTNLALELRALNVGCVVVAGLVTHGCVKATCLDGLRLGYHVILARDGHSSYSKDADKMIEQWNQKLQEAGVELQATQGIDWR